MLVKSDNRSSGLLRITKASEFGIFVVFICLCILMAILSPTFLKPLNLINILRQISIVGVISVGMAMVIIVGGIDLSVGANLALCACIAAKLANVMNSWIAVLIAIAVGGLIGLTSGLLVEKVGITAFIVTLGMMNVTRGLAYFLTGGIPVQFDHPAKVLGGGAIPITDKFSIPVSVIVMFMIYILGIIMMSRTVLGRSMYAVGDNEKASRISGIKTGYVKIMAFVTTGLLAGLAGAINAGNLTTAESSAGNGLELDCIAAVVIGGASMSGGEGSMVGILIGAALMGVIKNGFILLSFPNYLQTLTIGVVIILAVGIDCISKKRKQS